MQLSQLISYMNIASLWRLANRPPFDKGEVSSLCGQKRFFYDPLASNGGVWADWLLKAEKILLNLASNYRYRVFVQSELEWNEDTLRIHGKCKLFSGKTYVDFAVPGKGF